MAVVVVTEADTTLGEALTLGLAEARNIVIAASSTGRLPATAPGGVLPLRLDLRCPASVTSAVEELTDHHGAIDAVVANGMTGRFSPFELLDADELEDVLAVNFVGPLRFLHAVLPLLQESADPRVIGLSNVIGPIGLPGGVVPCGARAGFEIALQALRYELEPLGIRVSVVRSAPSDVAEYGLPFTGGAAGPYDGLIRSVNDLGCQVAPPEDIVATVRQALTMPEPNTEYPMGAYADLADELRRSPAAEVDDFVREFFSSSE